ncbi:hypothetical protein GCM10009765_60970 [Fodinicola feengrottensis]|uniref:Uncharacterized protein n=1 Tax=Fodinicola feengrottensis TaxID=435914 RepID=A0ABN2IED3_9ACTN
MARWPRHGANAADNARLTPDNPIVCRNNNPPAQDTNDSRTGSKTNPPTLLPFHLRSAFQTQ